MGGSPQVSPHPQPLKDAAMGSKVLYGRTALGMDQYRLDPSEKMDLGWVEWEGGAYNGTQFAGAVRVPQVCSGVRVGDKVTPLLTQLLSALFL